MIIINLNTGRQKWDGWGVSLMWWANAIEGFEKIEPSEWGRERGYKSRYEELMHRLFEAEHGLGLNIVRYNVGGGDDPQKDFINRTGARIPGYISGEGKYCWNADRQQIKVLKDAYQLIMEVGNKFWNTIFSVSPPYIWTYSGSSTGNANAWNDNLRWDKYKEFVSYLLDVVEYIQNVQKIPVTEIEPINEPTSGYWKYGSQKQEGCQFNSTPQPEIHKNNYVADKDPFNPWIYSAMSKIYEILGEELDRRKGAGKLQKVQITGVDETSIDATLESMERLTDKARNYIDKISTHEYEGAKRRELAEFAEKYHKPIWMSEVCYSGEKRNKDVMDKSVFQMCRDIRNDIYEMGISGWVEWQGIESLGENILWNSNWGIIHCLFEETKWKTEKETDRFGMSPIQYCVDENHKLDPERVAQMGYKRGDYEVTKQYYALGQYTRYLKPGYQIIETGDENMVAALSEKKDRLVLIVINEKLEETECSVWINGIPDMRIISAVRTDNRDSWKDVRKDIRINHNHMLDKMPEKSISTYVIALNIEVNQNRASCSRLE